MKNDAIFDNNNRCIYCNEIIPEGRQVCYACGQLMTWSKIWRANKTQGVFKEGHVYYAYSSCNNEQCCVDLTLMFGEGYEPISLADPRLIKCGCMPYNEELLKGKTK